MDGLEFSTLLEDKDLNITTDEHLSEMAAAILALYNNKDVTQDHILFGQIALGLASIPPDFNEFELPTPELINITLETMKYMDKEFPEFSLDVKHYIGVSCYESGLFFVKNNLEIFQIPILKVFKELAGDNIDQKELDHCEKLWDKFKDSNMEGVPDLDHLTTQIKQNIFIKRYTDLYFYA